MADVTASVAQVGETILRALQNAIGLGPETALAEAQASTGVTTEDINSADMSEVFDYMCAQPGLSPVLQSFLTAQSQSYGSGNTVYQGGSTATGGGYTGGGGGGYAGGGANAQVVQAVTQNYYEQNITDNSSDTNFIGNFAGDIDVDNDHVDVSGDNNAVNTGEGDQAAATGAGASVAQSESGDAQSNSGDDSILNQDGIQVGQFNTGDEAAQVIGNTGVVNTGDAAETANVQGSADGSGFQFGDGSTQGVASGNYLEEGAAVSGAGDATGQSVDTNVQSDVNEEHGEGHNLELDADGGFGRVPVQRVLTEDRGEDYDSPDSGHFSPDVNVNVEGGAGDQLVDEDAPTS